MKKRIRKKRHRGEFVEYGIELCVRLLPGLDVDGFNPFFDALINAVEMHGLCMGGGGNPKTGDCEFFVTRVSGGRCVSMIPEDRDEVVMCMEALDTRFGDAIVSFTVGPLVDAWR